MNEYKPIFTCYEEIKQREIRELKDAVRAARGQYVFQKDKHPYVMCNLDSGPCDLRVDSVEIQNISDVDVLVIFGYDEQAGQAVEISLEDIAYSHISFITEAIPVRKFTQSSFSISRLSREDLEQKGFDTSDVDDKTMEKLASKLGDDYCEQLFWISLEIIAESMGIPRREDHEEDDDE